MVLKVHVDIALIWALDCCITEDTIEIYFYETFSKHIEIAQITGIEVNLFCAIAYEVGYLTFAIVFELYFVGRDRLRSKCQPEIVQAGHGGPCLGIFGVRRVQVFRNRGGCSVIRWRVQHAVLPDRLVDVRSQQSADDHSEDGVRVGFRPAHLQRGAVVIGMVPEKSRSDGDGESVPASLRSSLSLPFPTSD